MYSLVDRYRPFIRTLELMKEPTQAFIHGRRGANETLDFRKNFQTIIQQQIKKSCSKNETSDCILWKEEVVA